MKEPIPARNQRILQMRKEGMSQTEVATRFKLSPSRVYLIEKQDSATRAMNGRRAAMIKQLQDADDMDKPWPAADLLDALGLIVVTRKRLVDHFTEKLQDQISLREFMDMCLDAPVEGMDFTMPPLLRVYGLGKKGFWSVVKGLTDLDMGSRCNQEWQTRLVKVMIKHVPAWAREKGFDHSLVRLRFRPPGESGRFWRGDNACAPNRGEGECSSTGALLPS